MLAKSVSIIPSASWRARVERVAAEIAAHAESHDRDDSFVEEGFALLKSEGFFSALVPAEMGGGGASTATICDCIRILARACSSTALAFSMHCHVVAVAAWRHKHMGAPTDGLLKRVAAEGLVLVSSGGGDWLASGGSAEKVEGGFRVTARKPFASGSAMGDLLNTSARYEDPEAGPTVLHFAVPLTAEGVRIEPTWQVMGMRGTGSNDVVLDGVFMPDAAIAGRRPAGEWHMLFHVISKMAFAFIYSAYLGVAERAREIALESARRRAPDPLLAQLAGEMENALTIARLANAEAIAIAEEREPGPETTSAAMQCRQVTGQHAIVAVAKALELAGGSAFYRRNALERLFRDIQAARFHPLTEKPQLDLTGRVALGWPIDG
jgi:alkylation response protein AidB-like acyl-CoA dehydrogenase